MADNKINVGGRLHSIATGNVLAGANEILDDSKNKKQSDINAETDAALEDRYTKEQTYSKPELNNLITTPNQQYVSVTANSQTTTVTDVLPATGAANTVYRVGNWDGSQFDASVYSEYAWNGNQYVHLSTKTKIGEVFDISAYHATGGTLATYADLSAALDFNNGGGVPQSLQKGGMSIKFVQSSDNKYVQARCMAQNFTTDVTQWQGVDDKPTAGSENLVESGGVAAEFANIGEKVENVSNIEEDKFAITDSEGNVGLKYNEDGLDANTVTEHFKGLIVNDEKERAQEAESAINDDVIDLKASTENISNIDEDRFAVTDINGNIGLEYGENGLDAGAVSEHFKTIVTTDEKERAETEEQKLNSTIKDIEALIKESDGEGISITDDRGCQIWNINFKICKENGIFFVDSNGNVGYIWKTGTFDSANIGNNIRSIIESITSSGFNESDYALIKKTNTAITELNELKNNVDNSIKSLLDIAIGNSETYNLTISNNKARDKFIVPIRLHYEAQDNSRYNVSNNQNGEYDIFFNKTCKKNFEDVRFFDANGNVIPAILGDIENVDILEDDRLDYVIIYVTSTGYIIGGMYNGVYISKNNGASFTLISGTDVANAFSPLVGIDNNDDLYVNISGTIYKYYAADDYSSSTRRNVLDIKWSYYTDEEHTQSTTVTPMTKEHQFQVVDVNGTDYIFIAVYQIPYNVQLYRSVDGGETFTNVFTCRQKHGYSDAIVPIIYYKDNYSSPSDYTQDKIRTDCEYYAKPNIMQHIHNISVDPYTKDIFMCVDDGGHLYNGGFTFVSHDYGEHWIDLSPYMIKQRGKDFYPTYFGDGTYKLGGSESYLLGNSTVVRSEDDVHFTGHVGYMGGVRAYADFGNDSLILAGVTITGFEPTNVILSSNDKGLTWKRLSSYFNNIPTTTPGVGYRKLVPCQIVGENEKCVIALGGDPREGIAKPVHAKRVYKGGDHWYREVYLILDNVAASNIQITAKTGYCAKYPYYTYSPIELRDYVYRVPLNEGSGKYISDIEGNVFSLNKDYKWDEAAAIRINDLESMVHKKLDVHSALYLGNGGVNLGRIESLNFAKNFTLTFWLSRKESKFADRSKFTTLERFTNGLDDATLQMILSIGGYDLDISNGGLWICKRGTFSPTTNIADIGSKVLAGRITSALNYNNDYVFVALTIGENDYKVYANGLGYTATLNNLNNTSFANISESDLIIGGDSNHADAYLSDLRIYHRILTQEEVTTLYKGYNV